MDQLTPLDNASLPQVSIVVEWENVLLAGSNRAQVMLQKLIQQCNGCEDILEIIISANKPCPELSLRPSTLSEKISWRLKISQGSHYYELKNYGAEISKGEIIVFIDSDVIPSDYWLQELLSVFTLKNAKVCCGNAFIETKGFYNKSFALFWFFPLEKVTGEITPCKHFFANNIAFKKEIFLRHKFHIDEDSSRGACLDLAQSLQNDGVEIWRNPSAQVAHPPPIGIKNFCLRALAQGRDRQLRSYGMSSTSFGSFFRAFQNMIKSIIKILINFKRVRLNPLAIPFTILLAITYYTLYLLGEIGSQLKIKIVMRITI